MKKLIALIVLALSGVMLTAQPASAGTFTKVYGQTFDTPAALGQVGSVYGSNITGYTDGTPTTYKNGGCYYPSKTLSVANGVLDTYFHSETLPDNKGTAGACKFLSAAPVPYGWQNQTYGRFTVRMKSDSLAGYKVAFLLWPDSDNWGDGEIDFPEAGTSKPVTAAVHKISPGDPNQYTLATSTTTMQAWHTYTIDWTPGHIVTSIDGVVLKDFTNDVPSTPHHWVLQQETSTTAPATTTQGHLQIDAISVYKYS